MVKMRLLRRLKIRAWTAVLVGVFVLPVALFGAFYAVSGSHQVVPGLNGCRFVRDRSAQIDCYSKQFDHLISEDGLESAFTTVDRAAQHSTTLGADCHLAWHPPGERAGRKAARDGATFTYRRATTTCQKGYSHGYTIGFLEVAGKADPKGDIAKQMTRACAADSDIDTATSRCDEADYSIIPDEQSRRDARVPVASIVTGARFQCMYGMYMEYGMLDLVSGDAPLNNCTEATNPVARRACYSYLPSRVGAFKGNIADAAQSCHTLAPKGSMRDACVSYFSFGLDKVERCTLFPVDVERERCRDVVSGRLGSLEGS
jgi:hypothetical protein